MWIDERGADINGIVPLTIGGCMLRRTFVALGLVLAFACGMWTAHARAEERHPVLQRAIEQIHNIRMRLESAPRDFGGHKQKAIEALRVAGSELEQGIQFDKK
jgi:hypothetical protein